MKYLILAVLVLSSCGKAPSDLTFSPIVDQFVSDAATHGLQVQVNVPIQFGNVQSITESVNAAGACIMDPTGSKIVIDQNYWNIISTDAQKLLIYHELGHCVLGREHIDTSYSIDIPGTVINMPNSIMDSNVPGDTQLTQGGKAYEAALIDELFQNVPVQVTYTQ